MKKIRDKELLPVVLFWTDTVVYSSKYDYKKSKFLQARVFKFHANVQARSSAVWFLKQSKQMRLLQSSQAILHHVSLFRFKQCLQRPLENLWANALLLGAQNLRTIAVPKNFRSVTSQGLNEKPVGFLIGDVGTVSPKYMHLQWQRPQRTT